MTIEPLSTEAVERLSEWLEYRPGEGTDFASHAADLRALLQERAALREALEPFAVIARLTDRYLPGMADDERFQSGAAWRDKDGQTRTLTYGDFRRARQALTGAPNG